MNENDIKPEELDNWNLQFSPPYERLLTDIGFALDRWGRVEIEVDTIFQYAANLKKYQAGLMMAPIEGFRQKVKIVDSVVKGMIDLPEEIKAYWKLVRKQLSLAGEERNKLAHFSIQEDLAEGKPGMLKVVPYYSHGLDIFPIEPKGLSSSEIRRIGLRFARIASELMWLSGELGFFRGIFMANPHEECKRPDGSGK